MSNEKVVVTGVNGFVGPHVVAELHSHGIAVVGFGREVGPGLEVPLDDYRQVDLVGSWPRVDGITGVVHLAGLSAVGPSFDQPQAYIDVNGSMIHRLAEWSKRWAPDARALVVSTGAVYDSAFAGPMTESSPLAMTSPYVVSKALTENLAMYYRRRGHDWLVARPFNHVGPGQGSGFLIPDLADQFLAQRAEETPVLMVGDLSTARDYTDVRDVARAYRLLLSAPAGHHFTYNVCSGESRSGHELLETLARVFDVPRYTTEVDTTRVRPDDPREIIGSAKRLTALTGWTPTHSIDDCIGDFVVKRVGGPRVDPSTR